MRNLYSLRFGLYADVIDSTVCTTFAMLYLFYYVGIKIGDNRAIFIELDEQLGLLVLFEDYCVVKSILF